MATEKLIVKNFGPIREVELDLKKVTVFIGEQASGKSVLAKLIKVFSNIVVNEESFWTEIEDLNLLNFFEKNTHINYQNEGHNIELKGKNKKIFNYSIENLYLKKLADTYLETQKTVTAIENRFNDVASQYDVYEDIYLNTLSKVGTLRAELTKLPINSIYIPTERIILSIIANSIFSLTKNQIPIPNFLISFGELFEQARKSIKDIFIKPLNLKYMFYHGNDWVVLENGKHIRLQDGSSGIHALIPFYLILESFYKNGNGKKRTLLEEPELNLFPSTQKKLVDYLIEKCTKGDNRLIITTHSPYVLTALNNLIQAKNVVKKSPELADEVAKIVPPQYQLDFDDTAVYFVGNGTAYSILNIENQLIDASALDAISEEIGEDFGKLIQLEFQNEPA
jgi:predicted ATPase